MITDCHKRGAAHTWREEHVEVTALDSPKHEYVVVNQCDVCGVYQVRDKYEEIVEKVIETVRQK